MASSKIVASEMIYKMDQKMIVINGDDGACSSATMMVEKYAASKASKINDK